MADPVAIGSLLISAAKVVDNFMSGSSPRDKALKQLQLIMKKGLDPTILRRLMQAMSAREAQAQSGVLARARAGNLDPSSGLVQEMLGASRRNAASREGELRQIFDDESERVKRAAMAQLANLPEDTSGGDLLGSSIALLDTVLKRKRTQDEPEGWQQQSGQSVGLSEPEAKVHGPVRSDVGMKMYRPSDFYADSLMPDIRNSERLNRVSPLNYRKNRYQNKSLLY